eukprot:gene15086-biopygen24148
MYVGSVEQTTDAKQRIVVHTTIKTTTPTCVDENKEDEDDDASSTISDSSKAVSTRTKASVTADAANVRIEMAHDSTVHIPALFKIFDEILVNALDQVQENDAVRRIDISVDRGTGVIGVRNDGVGLPVEMHPEHECYTPELIFGHMLTSANYDDDMERTIGGQNGIGAKACNIFSEWFEVETLDATRRLKYTQRFEENMSRTLPPTISPVPARTRNPKQFVSVRFLPDYKRFGGLQSLPEDILKVMERRAYDIAALTPTRVTVTFNDHILPIRSFEQYANIHGNTESELVFENLKMFEGLEWEVGAKLSDTGFQQVSFVNGLNTVRGGKHVEYILQNICKRVVEYVSNTSTKIGRSLKQSVVKPQFVRESLFLFVRATIPNPTFDSQAKELLTTPATRFGGTNKKSSSIGISERFIGRLCKLDGFVDRVSALSGVATERDTRKTDGAKRSVVYGVKKLDDAEWAGTAKSEQCTLILTEGDSAKAMAVAGLAVVGRQLYGVYPLRGKVMNVCDAPSERISANEEISNIKKIMGLQSGRVYDSVKDLRYGRIMVMTDQDVDGSHIKGLVFNLFHQLWPSLLAIDGFMTSMLTPIVKVKQHSSKQKQNVVSFYNISDFERWQEEKKSDSSRKSWTAKYYKGLGTSTSEEAREYFRELRTVTYHIADERTCLYHPLWTVLKVSQRKALFGCFKRCGPSNDNFPEARVAQLAAYVSEHSLFHHGEASMQGTIIAMAQNFVGAGNNLNLLQPIGQFGSRLGGGSDHASPRYIHTCLEPVTRALFPREDDRVLEYLTDDGTSVEPRFYAPIIPLVLANGADGIGTGYSTHIPCFDPRDLVIAIRERICGTERITKLKPWYKGFRGEVGGIRVNGREVITGSVVKVGATKARITELPVGVWIDDFKETLENFVGDNAKGVKGFSNESTEDNVSFTITFSNSAMASSWLQVNTTQDSEAHDDDIGYGDTVNGLTRLEIELKMYVSKPLCMTNMHLFDASGRIRKYSSPEEILDEFLEQRMKVYVQRKAWLERELAETLRVLEQKVRFVELVVTGELDVFKEVVDDDNDDDVEDDDDSSGLDSSSMQQGPVSPDAKERKRVHALERHGLECVKGSFRYLLSMPVSCLTRKRKDALERERDARRTELEAVRVTDEKDMYVRDLERLEKFLIKQRHYGLENIAYNKVVPNITVKGKISFQTPKNNNTDNYTLRKVVHGVDKSSLRLTINDDSDEVFEIWGDSCANGGCGGEGAVAHKFTADGNAWHKGGMTADVTNVNRIKLGNKWSLSGVGDKHGNDDWLRLSNKDGTGYYGGLAAGRLWSVGATTLNGPTYTKDITASGNLNVNGGNAKVCVDGACITKGDINTFKAAKGSISQLQHKLTATTSLAQTQQKVSAENKRTIANLQQELSATTSIVQTQQTLSAMNEGSIAQLKNDLSETKEKAKALAKAQAQAQAHANEEALSRANASNAEAMALAAQAHSQSRANAEEIKRANEANAALHKQWRANASLHAQSRENAQAKADEQARAKAKADEQARAKAKADEQARAKAAAQGRSRWCHESCPRVGKVRVLAMAQMQGEFLGVTGGAEMPRLHGVRDMRAPVLRLAEVLGTTRTV